MVHVLLVGTWPSRSCVIDSAMSNLAESLCLCRDPAFVLAPGAPLHPVESEVIWGLRSGLPQEESLTPQALRSRWGCRWNGLGPLQSGVHHPFPSVLPLTTRCRSLHRRVSSLSPGMTTRLRCPFGCGSVVRARPRDDGYAFPGRRECRARVESSTASRSFEAGRVVSRWGSCWFSAPPSGAILSGSAWGAYKIVEGTFHCPKQILWLLRPHHPRWWGCFGVHGHPLGGAVCGHATVSNSRYHPAGWSVSPLTGL